MLLENFFRFIYFWLVYNTFGELCLSPIGVMTKLSPQNPSCNDGMWFLASAYGQYAGLLGAIAEHLKTQRI
jgi:dipeptide/tripeptide permease